MKMKPIAYVRRLMSLVAALCLISAMMLSAAATGSTANQSVLNDKTGIVQVKLVYIDPDTRVETPIQSGTGFLINDTNVITCYHVVTMESDTLTAAATYLGKSETVVQNNCVIQIVYLRDTTPITASITIGSSEMDFAVLSMSSQLYSRTYLSIRSSDSVEQSETVYAMGFPTLVEEFQDVNTFNSDDITINDGRVSKLNTINGVDFIQCSAAFNSGMSGGPLVDETGYVVGIIQSTTSEGTGGEYYYAIAIDQVVTALNDRGIEYTTNSNSDSGSDSDIDTNTVDKTALQSLLSQANALGSSDATLQSAISSAQTVIDNAAATQTEVDNAYSALQSAISQVPATVDKSSLESLVSQTSSLDTSLYTDESVAALESAMTTAQSVLSNDSATQTDVDSAYSALSNARTGLTEKEDNTMMIIIIAVVAVVVVILVVVLVVILGKKGGNKKNGGNDNSYNYDAYDWDNRQGGNQTTPTTNETSVLDQGAGETSVLNQGAGETSVLNQNCGSLLRTKTGETVRINAASFVIGKEQSKCNYCIRDNTAVSRAHAKITSSNGVAYITDMRTTNGSFVNGVRLNPMQETQLQDGDIILLADEEFVYHTY